MANTCPYVASLRMNATNTRAVIRSRTCRSCNRITRFNAFASSFRNTPDLELCPTSSCTSVIETPLLGATPTKRDSGDTIPKSRTRRIGPTIRCAKSNGADNTPASCTRATFPTIFGNVSPAITSTTNEINAKPNSTIGDELDIKIKPLEMTKNNVFEVILMNSTVTNNPRGSRSNSSTLRAVAGRSRRSFSLSDWRNPKRTVSEHDAKALPPTTGRSASNTMISIGPIVIARTHHSRGAWSEAYYTRQTQRAKYQPEAASTTRPWRRPFPIQSHAIQRLLQPRSHGALAGLHPRRPPPHAIPSYASKTPAIAWVPLALAWAQAPAK